MIPVILTALITAILVGAPFSVWVVYLFGAAELLNDQLDATKLRKRTQRARAIAAELDASRLRRRCASLTQRVAEAEGWAPGETHLDDAPASRPASPPPESRSRA